MDKETRKRLEEITVTRKDASINAWLGNLHTGDLFVEEGNYTKVYATVEWNGQVMKVPNYRFPSRFRVPVKIGYAPNSSILEVLEIRRGVYPNLDLPHVPNHPHEWGKSDNPAWIRKENVLELLPAKKTGMIVTVNSGHYSINGNIHAFLRREFDMSSYVPVSGAKWVAAEIDDNGNITYEEGTAYDNRIELDITNLPAVTNDKYRLFALKVYEDQTEIIYRAGENDIYDPRFVFAAGTTFVTDWNDLVNMPSEFAPDADSTYYVQRVVSTSDPAANDDVNDGYRNNALWLNTTNDTYWALVDNTAGAAVWLLLGSGAGDLGWEIDGALAVSDPAAVPLLITKDTTLAKVYVYCEDTGTSGTTEIDITLNGSSSILSSALQLAYNDANGWASATPATTEFVEGDILSLSIDGIAAGAGGLRVILQPSTSSGGGGAGFNLTVKEDDASPSVSNVETIVVPAGSLTDDGGGQVTIKIPRRGVARAYASTAQTIATSEVRINFDTVDDDDDATITTGASWVWTAPYDCVAVLSAQVGRESGEYLILYWYVNGVKKTNYTGFGFTNWCAVEATTHIKLDAGDTIYVTIKASASSANSWLEFTHFSVSYIER